MPTIKYSNLSGFSFLFSCSRPDDDTTKRTALNIFSKTSKSVLLRHVSWSAHGFRSRKLYKPGGNRSHVTGARNCSRCAIPRSSLTLLLLLVRREVVFSSVEF